LAGQDHAGCENPEFWHPEKGRGENPAPEPAKPAQPAQELDVHLDQDYIPLLKFNNWVETPPPDLWTDPSKKPSPSSHFVNVRYALNPAFVRDVLGGVIGDGRWAYVEAVINMDFIDDHHAGANFKKLVDDLLACRAIILRYVCVRSYPVGKTIAEYIPFLPMKDHVSVQKNPFVLYQITGEKRKRF
jgi:hypothetical protein